MKNSLIVLERELSDRRLLWGLGLLGLVPLGLPLLGVLQPEGDSQIGVALVLSWLVGAVLAIFLGATVIGNDLAERRLGFYFSRPISGWSLWAGKTGAATVLAFGIGFLILLPTVLVHGWPEPALASSTAWAAWVCGTLLLLAAAHAVGVMVRARDAWLALDLAVLAGGSLTIWQLAHPLWLKGQEAALQTPLAAFQGLILSGLLLAGAFQVIRGRADLRRGHRILSLGIAALVVSAASAFGAYSHWYLHPGLRDFVAVHSASASRDGRWIALEGKAAHREGASFALLVDLQGHRRLPIELAPMGWGPSSVYFSADGRRAVWLAPRSTASRDCEIVSLTLDGPERPPVTSLVAFEAPPPWLTLSPKGSRIAALQGETLTVSDVGSGRLLTKISAVGPFGANFLDEDRILVSQPFRQWESGLHGEPRHGAFELDLATGRRTPRTMPNWTELKERLHRARNPPALPTVPGASTHPVPIFGYRGLVVRWPDRRQVELRIASPTNREMESWSTFRFDQAADLEILDPTSSGQQLLARVLSAAPGQPPPPSRYVLLDLKHGTQRDVGATPPFAVTSSVLLFRTAGGLKAVDPRTGAERPVADS